MVKYSLVYELRPTANYPEIAVFSLPNNSRHPLFAVHLLFPPNSKWKRRKSIFHPVSKIFASIRFLMLISRPDSRIDGFGRDCSDLSRVAVEEMMDNDDCWCRTYKPIYQSPLKTILFLLNSSNIRKT